MKPSDLQQQFRLQKPQVRHMFMPKGLPNAFRTGGLTVLVGLGVALSVACGNSGKHASNAQNTPPATSVPAASATNNPASNYSGITVTLKGARWYNKAGSDYADRRDFLQAISKYDTAIDLDSGYAAAYYNRGTMYAIVGDFRQAIRDFDKTIELKPRDAKAYCNRGAAYTHLGDFLRAIDDYGKALELDSLDATTYYNLGVAYDGLGNSQQAIADFSKAIELDPGYAKAYHNRAVAYRALGRDAEAAVDQLNYESLKGQ